MLACVRDSFDQEHSQVGLTIGNSSLYDRSRLLSAAAGGIDVQGTKTKANVEYQGRAIHTLINDLSDSPQFEAVPEDINGFKWLEPFRVLGSGRLTQAIAKTQCILYAFDRVGLSMVLGLPVPPASTLTVRMSTWVTSRHSDDGIDPTSCFGVGMIPEGSPVKEEKWVHDGSQTSIENGVQFYADFDLSTKRAMNMIDVREGGFTKKVLEKGQAKPSLDPMTVTLSRDEAGGSELTFSKGARSLVVSRPDTELESKNQVLYINCLSKADSFTCIRFDHISLKSNDVPSPGSKVPKIDSVDIDYNTLFQSNPELRRQVDELIFGLALPRLAAYPNRKN